MANIQDKLNNIKNALFGKDVRNSIHDGIDAINKEVESTTNRQEHLETTFDQLTINAGNSNAEIVDARVGENGKSYAKLGDRLDSVDSQLEQNVTKVMQLENSIFNDFKNGKVLRIGHRCCGYIYPSSEENVKELNVGFPPENSISALYNCIETGLFWGVEIDIKPCNDKWVVIHDGDLKRTHNGDIAKVNDYNSWNLNTKYYATTNKYAADYRYNTEGIATLKDFLYTAKSLNTNVIIEVKTTFFKEGFLDKLYDDVKSNYMLNNVVFIVSTIEMCDLIRSKFGDITLILALDVVDNEKINYIKSNINMIALLHTTIVSKLKDDLNNNSIPWVVYGINTIDAYKYYSNLGVSGILTDMIIGGER